MAVPIKTRIPAELLEIYSRGVGAPGLQFDANALTARRVITMPDANVNLGQVGAAPTFAQIQTALTNQVLNIGLFGTILAHSVGLREARVFSPAAFPLVPADQYAGAIRGWRVDDLATNSTAFIETAGNIYNGHRVIAVAFGILTTISGGGVARFDIGYAADPDAFTPIQQSGLVADFADVQGYPSAQDEFGIAASALRVSFYEADGTTPAEPTAGSIRVAVLTETYTIGSFF